MRDKVEVERDPSQREEEEGEEEEEINPCTGLGNPHRTARTEKAVYLLLFLPPSTNLPSAHNLKSFQST